MERETSVSELVRTSKHVIDLVKTMVAVRQTNNEIDVVELMSVLEECEVLAIESTKLIAYKYKEAWLQDDWFVDSVGFYNYQYAENYVAYLKNKELFKKENAGVKISTKPYRGG